MTTHSHTRADEPVGVEDRIVSLLDGVVSMFASGAVLALGILSGLLVFVPYLWRTRFMPEFPDGAEVQIAALIACAYLIYGALAVLMLMPGFMWRSLVLDSRELKAASAVADQYRRRIVSRVLFPPSFLFAVNTAITMAEPLDFPLLALNVIFSCSALLVCVIWDRATFEWTGNNIGVLFAALLLSWLPTLMLSRFISRLVLSESYHREIATSLLILVVGLMGSMIISLSGYRRAQGNRLPWVRRVVSGLGLVPMLSTALLIWLPDDPTVTARILLRHFGRGDIPAPEMLVTAAGRDILDSVGVEVAEAPQGVGGLYRVNSTNLRLVVGLGTEYLFETRVKHVGRVRFVLPRADIRPVRQADTQEVAP